jgi:hypothetical protein
MQGVASIESPIALCVGWLQALLLMSLCFKYQTIAFIEYIQEVNNQISPAASSNANSSCFLNSSTSLM